MAIDSTLYCRPTDSIVLPAKRKFFPTDIPIPHPQLRHFISTADRDWIYYATEYDIYCFHLPTQRKRLLITLPFTPRCLTAGLGWICAGGEYNGDLAFIKQHGSSDTHIEVDESLPLESTTLDSKTSPQEPASIAFPDLKPELILEQLGGYIVNSATIHALAQEQENDPPEPVAVLSNNDKTVKIFSLLRRQVIADLSHATCMNYAVISPGSKLLVAVGDENRAYFYRREALKGELGFFEGKTVTNYRWKLFARPRLPSDGSQTDDCCFSAAFSPAGHLCAVAAQNGMISVFDVNVLVDTLNQPHDQRSPESAMLCTFRSSRPPGFLSGAVRSMAFSPEPWDLLLWAEEHGRAGIADVRQHFGRRQILKLETHAADMERIVPEDLTDPHLKQLDPESRMLHQFRETMASDEGRDSPSSGQSRWPRAQRTRARSTTDAHEEFTERERSLVESIRTRRVAEDEYQDTLAGLERRLAPGHANAPYSVNYTSSPRVRASLAQAGENRSRSARLRAMMSQFMRDMDGDATEDRTYQPRRRSSVVLSQSNQAQNSANLAAPSTEPRSRMTASPSRLSPAEMEQDEARPHSVSTALEASGAFSDNPNSSDEAWRIIQTALEPQEGEQGRTRYSDRAFMSMFQRQQSDLPELERRIDSELPELERRIEQQQRQLEQLQREMTTRINGSPIIGSQPSTRDARGLLREAQELHRRAQELPPHTTDRDSDLDSWQDIANALEPFDPTGISPDEVEAARELHHRQHIAATQHAQRLRQVIFRDDPPTAHSSALPTTNANSLSATQNGAPTSDSDANIPFSFLARHYRIYGRGPSDRDNQISRRPSTPPSSQPPRNRSQSPMSRALILARAQSAASVQTIPNTSSTNALHADTVQTPSSTRIRTEWTPPTHASTTTTTHPTSTRPTRLPSTPSTSTRGTTLSHSIRQARIMAIQNATARMMDVNGNWMPGDALSSRMMSGAEGAGGAGGESWSERGVGTAGVGWSWNGKNAYVGTEEGIFEFTINLGDRRTFPSFVLR